MCFVCKYLKVRLAFHKGLIVLSKTELFKDINMLRKSLRVWACIDHAKQGMGLGSLFCSCDPVCCKI